MSTISIFISTEGALSIAPLKDFLPIPCLPHVAFGATSVSYGIILCLICDQFWRCLLIAIPSVIDGNSFDESLRWNFSVPSPTLMEWCLLIEQSWRCSSKLFNQSSSFYCNLFHIFTCLLCHILGSQWTVWDALYLVRFPDLPYSIPHPTQR